MTTEAKPSLIARGVEHAIRRLCELWGYDWEDEATSLPDADNLQPVAGELDVPDEQPDPNAETVELETVDLDAEPASDLDRMLREDEEDAHARAIHREALRHLLEVAEELHENAREAARRPPTRPV